MSKIYNEYLRLKQKDFNKIYLIKNGNFYIFLDEDAKVMSEELGLKLSKFNNKINKCGFPITELNKYLKFIKLLKFDYEIIYLGYDFIINDILNLDLNHLDEKEVKEKLKYYQKLLGDIRNGK